MSEDDSTIQTSDGNITIKVRSKKTGRSVTYERTFGKDLDESVALFGKDTVYDVFISQAVIRSQGAARANLDAQEPDGTPKNTPEQAIEAGLAYEPGRSRPRADSGVTREKAFQTLAKQVQSGEISLEDLVARIQALQQAQA